MFKKNIMLLVSGLAMVISNISYAELPVLNSKITKTQQKTGKIIPLPKKTTKTPLKSNLIKQKAVVKKKVAPVITRRTKTGIAQPKIQLKDRLNKSRQLMRQKAMAKRTLPANTPPARNNRPVLSNLLKNKALKPDRLKRMNQASQARGVKEAADAMDAMRAIRDMTGFKGNSGQTPTSPEISGMGRGLGGRFADAANAAIQGSGSDSDASHPDTKRMPGLPSNSSKNSLSSFARPSMNPADWMSGSAGFKTTTTTEDDGTVVATERSNDGNTEQITRDAPDGGRTQVVNERQVDGGITSSMTSYDRAGNVIYESSATYDSNGNQETFISRDSLNRTIDPNADTNTGGFALPSTRKADFSLRTPDRVNPGRDTSGVESAQKINPGQAIVVNPLPDSVRNAADASSLDKTRIRESIGSADRVNPPNPDD